MMIVSLYTSRVTLNVLGEEDFGIYNLVAGFVVLFGFLNYAMERATLRFLLVEKGKGTVRSMQRVFNVSITSHIFIAAAVVLIAETVGLWFVNTQLNIADDKISVANIVYQLAIISTIFNIIRVPYNSTIVAYEKMSFYAYFSILEAVLRLGGVLLLQYFFLKQLLTLYSIILLIVTIVSFGTYKFYCTGNFETCRFKLIWDKRLFFQMLSFSAWSMVGGAGNIAAQQGVSIILNIFFGVIINAAVGITYQVGQAINNIISSFQTAFNPRLVKLYVNNEIDKFRNIIITSSKLSYYLAMIMVIPLIINMDFILHIWLGNNVPPHTCAFCQLFLVFYAVDAMSAPLWMANQATGKIRIYNIVFAIFLLLNLPFCYLAMRLGAEPEIAFIIRIAINVLLHIFRIFYLHYQVGLPIKKYILNSLIIPLLITCLVIPIPIVISMYLGGYEKLMVTSILAIVISCIIIYCLGLNQKEKLFVKELVNSKLKHTKP